MSKKRIFILACSLLFTVFTWSQNKKFKVVLDAGHGGKDYGATYHGNIEKNIALKTVLKIGAILEKEPDIEVVYTRNTDVFVELDERANIANKSKGHLFISVHCNANANQTADGNETFVMGITRNAANLEVAKKENAVVTLEKNYKIKYDGFDPNKPESVMGLSIQQEENLEQSIAIASKIQEAFIKYIGNKNRGVKQAGFLVLRKITMPRILVEMGFVSHKTEGAFLNSEHGQDKLAEAISTAVLSYKKESFATETPKKEIEKIEKKEEVKKEDTPKKETSQSEIKTTTPEAVVFSIQIATSAKKLETIPSNFKGLKKISIEQENKLYKYFYGEVNEYKLAQELLKEAQVKGYTSAFIVATKKGKKISISEAIK